MDLFGSVGILCWDLFGPTWTHLDLFGFYVGTCLDLFGSVWILCGDLFGPTWTYLDLFGFYVWNCLDLHGPVRIHLKAFELVRFSFLVV